MNVDVLKIKSLMTYKQITMQELGKELGISQATLRTRFSHPEEFSQGEMATLIKILDIDEPSTVFFV